MNYFQLVPDLVLTDPQSNDGSATITVKNIFRSIRFRSDIKKYVQFFEEYTIKDTQRPSDVAYEIYGNPNYDWLVLLFNNIKNLNDEWPRSTQQMNDIIRTKYTNPYDVHHYETKKYEFNGIQLLPEGLIVEKDFTFTTPSIISGYQFYGTIEEGSPVIFIRGSADILATGPVVFKNAYAGAPLRVGTNFFPDGTEIVEVRRNIDNTYYVTVDKNALVTSEEAIQFGSSKFGPVTLRGDKIVNRVYNYDYEMELNEKKRNISLLSPNLLLTVEEEFRRKLEYQEITEYAPENTEYSIEAKINSFY